MILVEVIIFPRKFNCRLYYNNVFIIITHDESVIDVRDIYIYIFFFNFLILIRIRVSRFLIAI